MFRDQYATGKEPAIFAEVMCFSEKKGNLGEICPWEKLSDLHSVLEGRDGNHIVSFFPFHHL